MKALQQQISSGSSSPGRAYSARNGVQTDSLDSLDVHGASSSSSACPSPGMWNNSLDGPSRERQQQGSPTAEQKRHSALASAPAASEPAGSDELSFSRTPIGNNDHLQTEHATGGFPAWPLAAHLARYTGGHSFASSRSASSKSSSSRFWGSNSSRDSSLKLLHCDLQSEQSRASRTGSLPAELSQQPASPSTHTVNSIHMVEDAEVAAITAAGSPQPHHQQQHSAHQRCSKGRASAPPRFPGSGGCDSSLRQRSCSAAVEGAAAGVPAFQSNPYAAGPHSTTYNQPGLDSTPAAVQRVRQVQSSLPPRVQISTALKQQLMVVRASSPHLLPHTSNRSSTLLSGVPDSFGGLDLDPVAPVANLTLQDAAGVKGGLMHGFAGVGALLGQVHAVPASPRVVVLPGRATHHSAVPHSPASHQQWSAPPARARGPAAAAAGDYPVSPGHSGHQQVQHQMQQGNEVQQLCRPNRKISSPSAQLLERGKNGPACSLCVSPEPQACCASPQGSTGCRSMMGSGTGADTGTAEESRGRTRERSSAARCLRVPAGPERAGNGDEQQQQPRVRLEGEIGSLQRSQDGYKHNSSMSRNRFSRSLSRSASRAVKGSQDGYASCDNADGSSHRHGVPGRAAREAHRAVEPLGPLDLDPTAPVLVGHKLSQPDFTDVDYIVHRWSHRWQCDRTIQAASAMPSAAAAAGGCLPQQQQQHFGFDCPASPAATSSNTWVRPPGQLQLFGASPVDTAMYIQQRR